MLCVLISVFHALKKIQEGKQKKCSWDQVFLISSSSNLSIAHRPKFVMNATNTKTKSCTQESRKWNFQEIFMNHYCIQHEGSWNNKKMSWKDSWYFHDSKEATWAAYRWQKHIGLEVSRESGAGLKLTKNQNIEGYTRRKRWKIIGLFTR
jgi:hypothetical protein